MLLRCTMRRRRKDNPASSHEDDRQKHTQQNKLRDECRRIVVGLGGFGHLVTIPTSTVYARMRPMPQGP